MDSGGEGGDRSIGFMCVVPRATRVHTHALVRLLPLGVVTVIVLIILLVLLLSVICVSLSSASGLLASKGRGHGIFNVRSDPKCVLCARRRDGH